MSSPATSSANGLKYFDGPDAGIRSAKELKEPTASTDEKFAIHIQHSSLDATNRRDYHVDVAKYALTSVCGGLKGNLYVFDNSDMVPLCPGFDNATLESVTHLLRGLFAGLTTIMAGNKTESICNWYDLTTQAAQFEEWCLPLTQVDALSSSYSVCAASPHKKFAPIKAEMLTQLERVLSTIDVSSFIRRQPICKILPEYVANEL